MEIEILLDLAEASTEDIPEIEKRFNQWYAEGAEVRYDKQCFGAITVIKAPTRYRVEFDQVDAMEAIRDLHARLNRFGVKVFVHFYH